MNTPNADNLIGAFLRSMLPPETEQAFALLASLEYPIPDMQTFRERLKRAAGDAGATILLTTLFEPEDFGMDTAQSAFEKYFKRSRHLSLPGVPLPRAHLQVLADIISAGSLSVDNNAVVFRSKGAVSVDCDCTDQAGSAGQGSCNIVIQGNILLCSAGTCKGSCTLTTTIPTANLFAAAVLTRE
ncbi:MAG: hypothetical protein IT324_25110 [Anaerolineae bacterium]|nr:hypothetical protein [Anaerolineae bacterium]